MLQTENRVCLRSTYSIIEGKKRIGYCVLVLVRIALRANDVTRFRPQQRVRQTLARNGQNTRECMEICCSDCAPKSYLECYKYPSNHFYLQEGGLKTFVVYSDDKRTMENVILKR